MSTGSTLLHSSHHPEPAKILQLYTRVELFSEGEPPSNSLFVQGTANMGAASSLGSDTQLLIIDPSADASTRFRVDGQVAALFTGEAVPVALPLVHTVPGGVAHIRLGDHFVDIYSRQYSNIIMLPALGILCSGQFGSNVSLPLLAADSDGSDELDTCLLLAQLIKQHRLQLMIPRTGGMTTTKSEALEHVATDVGYLHGLRRVVTPLAQQQGPLEQVQSAAATLIPRERTTPTAQAVHRANVARFYRSCSPLPD